MKTLIHFSLPCLAICFFVNAANSQDSWRKKADFKGAGRGFASGFSIGNRGYIACGDTNATNNLKPVNDFWEYNPDSDKWTQKASIPELRFAAIAFSIGNKGFIGTGNGGSDFWEYDPSKNSWTRKADFPGHPRLGTACFSVGGKGYTGLGFGFGTGTEFSDFWEYDTSTNKWTQKSDFPGSPRDYAVGFSIGNKGFIGTGVDDNNTYYNDFWEYNPFKDNWIQESNIGNSGRYGAIGFSIANQGYIGFGYIDQIGVENDIWAYDTTNNQWTQMSYCDTSYMSLSPFAFSIGNKGYVGSGLVYPNKLVNDFYQYSNHTSGINTPDNKIDFNIYPNPNAGNFTINSSYPIESYEICDMSGKLLYSDIIHSEGNYLNINVSLPNGLYIVRIISNNGASVKKILVTN